MGFKKEEIVLFTLDQIEGSDRNSRKYTKDQLASALDISINTFDLYLTKLARKNDIERIKKHFLDDIRRSYGITRQGKDRLTEIKKRIEEEYLTPERHNIPAMVPISVILGRIPDPLERSFFLSLFSRLKRFDFPFYLETIKTSKRGNNIIDVIKEIEKVEDEDNYPVVETFFRTCFYGISEPKEEYCNEYDPNTLLIIAEASVKQGRYNNARTIYQHLLSPKVPLTQNQWTIASINIAFLDFKEGDSEKAMREIENIMEKTDNKIMKAYSLQMKARILAASRNDDEALRLFTRALNSFKTFGLPLLQAITHNNRGIVYFRRNDLDMAEKEWDRCRKLAKGIGAPFVEGCATSNLANVERVKGNFEKSRSYLGSFYDFFTSIGDYESKAYLDFIYAMYYLDNKDKGNALKHFTLSETIAYPSPSPMEREERRKIFLDCATSNGFNKREVLNILKEE